MRKGKQLLQTFPGVWDLCSSGWWGGAGGADGHWWESNGIEPAGLRTFPGLQCGSWTPSGAASMIQVWTPTLQGYWAAASECPNCSYGCLGFSLQPILINSILPSGFEGRWAWYWDYLTLSSCPRKTARTSVAPREAFLGKDVLPSDLVKDQLVLPERCPSSLFSAEFKYSLF